MLKFTCEFCGQRLGVPDTFAGKRVRCTKCRAISTVPAPVKGRPSPPPPAANTPQAEVVQAEEVDDLKQARPRQSSLLSMGDGLEDSMAGMTDSRIFGTGDGRIIPDFRPDVDFTEPPPQDTGAKNDDLFDSKGNMLPEPDSDNIFDSKADGMDMEAAAIFHGAEDDPAKPKPSAPGKPPAKPGVPPPVAGTPQAPEEDFGLGLLEGDDPDLDLEDLT